MFCELFCEKKAMNVFYVFVYNKSKRIPQPDKKEFFLFGISKVLIIITVIPKFDLAKKVMGI